MHAVNSNIHIHNISNVIGIVAAPLRTSWQQPHRILRPHRALRPRRVLRPRFVLFCRCVAYMR